MKNDDSLTKDYYKLTWRFRNDHEWTKCFDVFDEMMEFYLNTGMTLHPDIIEIKYVWCNPAANNYEREPTYIKKPYENT